MTFSLYCEICIRDVLTCARSIPWGQFFGRIGLMNDRYISTTVSIDFSTIAHLPFACTSCLYQKCNKPVPEIAMLLLGPYLGPCSLNLGLGQLAQTNLTFVRSGGPDRRQTLLVQAVLQSLENEQGLDSLHMRTAFFTRYELAPVFMMEFLFNLDLAIFPGFGPEVGGQWQQCSCS